MSIFAIVYLGKHSNGVEINYEHKISIKYDYNYIPFLELKLITTFKNQSFILSFFHNLLFNCVHESQEYVIKCEFKLLMLKFSLMKNF